jgi:hypothetical protein
MKTLLLVIPLGFALIVCSTNEVRTEEMSYVTSPIDIKLSDNECRTRQLISLVDLKLSNNSQIESVKQSSNISKDKGEADKTIKVAGCVYPKRCHCLTGSCCCF